MRSILSTKHQILGICRNLSSVRHHQTQLLNSEVRKKRNVLFEDELKRQKDLIPRVEKITVECYCPMKEKNVQLLLNKRISTPFNAAQHIHETLIERSALATVNDQLWDMNRPLEEDCVLKFIHFQTAEDPYLVNKAFWRSCSFMLGATLDTLFQDQYYVELHSFPPPIVQSGSFVYDVDLKFKDWTPSKEELMSFSAYMHRLSELELPFERLTVDASVAIKMFEDNQYKSKQIPSIAANSKSGSSVTLYRLGEHIDISGGPMIGNSGFLGRRCSVMAAHPIAHDNIEMYRFQGVALPKGIFLDHYAYSLLEQRASKLNTTNISSYKSVTPS